MALALQKSVDPKAWEWGTAPKWGNISYKAEQEALAKETPAEKAKREAEEAAKREAMEKSANIQKKKARHVNLRTGQLKKIAKMCKWECQGEKCWAREGSACPFIHKGEAGWNESKAVAKPKAAVAMPKGAVAMPKGAVAMPKGAGAGPGKLRRRRSTRRAASRRNSTRRR